MLKTTLRSLSLLIVPFFASLLIKILYFTNKKKFYGPESLGDKPFIMAFWHGELLMMPYAYLKYKKTPHIKLMISEHFDGNILAQTMNYFNFETIRGSSTRGAAKVLIGSIKDIKNGYDIGITPDGPKGPRHEVADGIVVMAQKASVDIVLVSVKASKFWQLNSWDKFIIPKPFGIISYYISDLINVSDMNLEKAKYIIKEGLEKHEL